MGKWFSFTAEIGKFKPVSGFDKKDKVDFPAYAEPTTWKLIYKSSLGNLPTASTPAWTNSGAQTASMVGGVLTVTDNSTSGNRWWYIAPPNNWGKSNTRGVFQAEMKWTVKPTIGNAGTVFRTRNTEKLIGITMYNDVLTIGNAYTFPFTGSTNYHKYTLVRDNNDLYLYIDGVYRAKYLFSDVATSTANYLSIGAGSNSCKETKVYRNMKAWWM